MYPCSNGQNSIQKSIRSSTVITEHYLSGILQEAFAVLDKPDNDGSIVLEVRLHSFDGYPNEGEARNSLSGQNVTLLSTSQDIYDNIFLTRAYFKVTTIDKENKRFHFDLTLPSFSSHPKFELYNYPSESGDHLGNLYWLHSFDPINFEANFAEDFIILPDTYLENETYVLKFTEKELKCEPYEKVNFSECEQSVEISLFDKFGFHRAIQEMDLTEPSSKISNTSSKSSKTNLIPWIAFIITIIALVSVIIIVKRHKG
jgi:hypothetical protein